LGCPGDANEQQAVAPGAGDGVKVVPHQFGQNDAVEGQAFGAVVGLIFGVRVLKSAGPLLLRCVGLGIALLPRREPSVVASKFSRVKTGDCL
jgi:hypothetical protein